MSKNNTRDLIEDLDFIDEKYDFDHRDVARQSVFQAAILKQVLDQFGKEWYTKRPADYTDADRVAAAEYARLQQDTPPYQDFWHHVLDVYEEEINNDTYGTINWGRVRDRASEDWQKETAELFVKEFGDKDILYWISW